MIEKKFLFGHKTYRNSDDSFKGPQRASGGGGKEMT